MLGMWSFISVGLRGASVDRVSLVLFPPDSSDSQGLNRAGGRGRGEGATGRAPRLIVKWGVSMGLRGGGRPMSAARLKLSFAGPLTAPSDEVPGQEAVCRAVHAFGVGLQSKPPTSVNFVAAQLDQGPTRCWVPGPGPARAGGTEGILQRWRVSLSWEA